MAAAGIELFKSQSGWNIIVSNPKEYAKHLADADALVVLQCRAGDACRAGPGTCCA